MKTAQIQSKPYSRKAKSAAQDRKAVKEMDASFKIEMAALKAKQAPVAPVFPAKKSAASFFTVAPQDGDTIFASSVR